MLAVIFKILPCVVMKRLPAVSTATPFVEPKEVEVAVLLYTLVTRSEPRLPATVVMIPGNALAVGAGLDVGRCVGAVGYTVLVDTAGVTEGARITAALGVTTEYVIFRTSPLSQKYTLPAVSTAIPPG